MSAVVDWQFGVRVPLQFVKLIRDVNDIRHLIGPADQPNAGVPSTAADRILMDKEPLFQGERRVRNTRPERSSRGGRRRHQRRARRR